MMSRERFVLLLDSSTDYCSVALASDQRGVLSECEETDRSKQSERLAVMASEVLAELPKDVDLSAVCLAEGPGSYTGLRIATGYAKGLAWSRNIPLLAVTTPQLIALSYQEIEHPCSGALLMPMIDARRMEVYSALYNVDNNAETDIAALILTEGETLASLKELVGDRALIYFGSGAEKAQDIFDQLLPNSRYVPGIYPKAKDMAGVAFELLERGIQQDVAYWEPFYLKEYEAKKTLNKVLRNI